MMQSVAPVSRGELDAAQTALQIQAEIHILEQRLRDGEEMVRQKKLEGADREVVARWESYWVKLLRQYELLSDRLERQSAAAGE